VTDAPHVIRWTGHALVKADMLGIARSDVEAAILDGHHRRTRNPGAAEWRVRAGQMVIAYDYPDDADETTARVVTLWRE
jgi:hypothetical protein